MLYIQKGRLPGKTEAEINDIKRSKEWKELRAGDTTALRNVFDSLDKNCIRESLLAEQRYLCGYCMKRIQNTGTYMTIDHIVPVSADKEKVLDYKNMIGVCHGGRKSGTSQDKKRALCCDASKGDETKLKINPYDQAQMEKIHYTKDGQVYTEPNDPEMEWDINYVLHLNGLLDQNRRRISDTSTQLVKGRRDAYRQCVSFFRQLDRQNKCTSTMIKKKLDEIKNADKLPEYAGVKLYFLERKFEELRKRER